jgi:hypothetical protein
MEEGCSVCGVSSRRRRPNRVSWVHLSDKVIERKPWQGMTRVGHELIERSCKVVIGKGKDRSCHEISYGFHEGRPS